MKIYLLMKDYGYQCAEPDWCPFGGWGNIQGGADAAYYTYERASRRLSDELSRMNPCPSVVWEVDIETGDIREVLGS